MTMREYAFGTPWSGPRSFHRAVEEYDARRQPHRRSMHAKLRRSLDVERDPAQRKVLKADLLRLVNDGLVR